MGTFDHQIELAASHGSTKWVQRFIRSFLPQLILKQLSAEDFARSLDSELQHRSLTSLAQQKNYRSNIVQAIKSIDLHHPAISLISPTTEEYRELNDTQRGKLASRETRYFTSEQAQTLVDRATALLQSQEWPDVGAGLAVLIGRRISEILLSSFSPQSPWSLTFSAMAKKSGSETLSIEIPTLAPADLVLPAIMHLQQSLGTDDLRLHSLSPKMAKQAVNQRFTNPVAAKCVEHFSDLIPSRSDRLNLYTHVFRACYATIAAHWFCPPNVPEHTFKAEIQGHFTLTKDGQKLPNFSARANYDDYAIGSPDGNRDGRLGIKLASIPTLSVVTALLTMVSSDKDKVVNDSETLPITQLFSPTHEEPSMPRPSTQPKTKRPELYAKDWAEMTDMMAQRGVTGSSADVFHALLSAFKLATSNHQQQQAHSLNDLTSSLSWFTDRIDALEQSCASLQQERDQLLSSDTGELDLLRLENTQLHQDLQQTLAQLHGIQQLLGMAPASAPSTPAVPTAEAPLRYSRGSAITKINSIIDALISWNISQSSNQSRLRISIPIIKALGISYQPAIQTVLQTRSVELDNHHISFSIGSRHNAQVLDKDELLQAISRTISHQ
jgi:hypothetical protein